MRVFVLARPEFRPYMTLAAIQSLRFALRDGTRAAHERLDAKAEGFDLGSREGYAAFLRWHARLVPAHERALEAGAIDRLLPDWPDRRRSDALSRDLSHMGMSQPVSLTAEAPRSDAQSIGMAYVLEGSRLGATILSRRVAPSLRGEATAYLDHGAGLKLWPRFVDRMDTLDLSGAETEAAIAAANAVFAAFERGLDLNKADGAASGR